jgi:hypothetical protein
MNQTLTTTPFARINEESIAAHFSDGLLMQFKNNETIVNGIDEPDGVHLIKKGFVKAFSVSDAGLGNLLIIHQAGEFIPLPWALDGPHTTGLYYEAVSKLPLYVPLKIGSVVRWVKILGYLKR